MSNESSYGYEGIQNSYVGAQACKSCHISEYKAWENSDHFHAMAVANPKNVRGNFNNSTFKNNGTVYRFYKKNGSYMVHARGSDGKYHEYKIIYTFGWIPLQQYLIRFPKGKIQALSVAWDIRKKSWFTLYPNQNIAPNNWLYWTHGAMNWNTMCADCHSTDLKQNYIASDDSFHTTWSSINVSCEACHGPGEKHIDYIKSLNGKKPNRNIVHQGLFMNPGISSHKLVNECARCHSLREQMTNSYKYKGHFLDYYNPQLPHPPNYFSDGQIKHEDYVYASFLQSKMYHFGISCINCHDPHTMHLKLTGNNLCISCHEARTYDTPKHFHHKVNTKASLCINCHMPGRYYMQVDFRRDHSFRIPRPDLSVKYGTPNACNNCHKTKSAQWAAKTIKSWKATPKDHFFGFTEILAKADKEGQAAEPGLISLINDKSQPAIARATAIWYLGQFLDEQNINVIHKALSASSSLIRVSAIEALSNAPFSVRTAMLEPMVKDSIRAVRVAAANALADVPLSNLSGKEQKEFIRANKDLQGYFYATQYFPAGQQNQGAHFEKMHEWNKAIQAYKTALKKDSLFNPARINLAYVYNRLGQNDKAEALLKTVIKQEPDFGPVYFSLALLVSQKGRLKEALRYFKEASKKMPQNARVLYNEAIAYQKLNEYGNSETAYNRALKIDPDNTDYQYGILSLYMQHNEFGKALPHATMLVNLDPDNYEYQEILQSIKNKLK